MGKGGKKSIVEEINENLYQDKSHFYGRLSI